jgi:hypothetical protein
MTRCFRWHWWLLSSFIAGSCLYSPGLAYWCYVKTAGHALEEIAVAFGDQAFAPGNEEVMVTVDLKGHSPREIGSLVSVYL